jgi:hypothetical protein
VVAETDIARRGRVAFARRGHQQLEAFIHILRDAIPVTRLMVMFTDLVARLRDVYGARRTILSESHQQRYVPR